MNMHVKNVVEDCSKGSENDSLTFPQVLGKLAEAGVEGYYADLRRAAKTYYLPSGESIDVPAHRLDVPVAVAFDAVRVESAVRQSQRNEHTYSEFCRKIADAGCAGYIVSLPGRRAVYFGRTGETHVEHFPGGK